jgi:hypothetical protein
MTLRFFAAALTDAEDLNQRLAEIKAASHAGQPPEIDKIPFNILYRLTTVQTQ